MEEVDTAFSFGGGEPGEALVTDVGGVAVLALVASAGVVDVDIGAGGEACTQEQVFFVVEGLVVCGEEVAELACGDIDVPLVELAEQQRLGDALVVVLVHDEALQGRTEVSIVEVCGQFGDEAFTGGGVISSQAVAGIEGFDEEVLDDEVAVAAQARAGRQVLRCNDGGVVDFELFVAFSPSAEVCAWCAPRRRHPRWGAAHRRRDFCARRSV